MDLAEQINRCAHVLRCCSAPPRSRIAQRCQDKDRPPGHGRISYPADGQLGYAEMTVRMHTFG